MDLKVAPGTETHIRRRRSRGQRIHSAVRCPQACRIDIVGSPFRHIVFSFWCVWYGQYSVFASPVRRLLFANKPPNPSDEYAGGRVPAQCARAQWQSSHFRSTQAATRQGAGFGRVAPRRKITTAVQAQAGDWLVASRTVTERCSSAVFLVGAFDPLRGRCGRPARCADV